MFEGVTFTAPNCWRLGDILSVEVEQNELLSLRAIVTSGLFAFYVSLHHIDRLTLSASSSISFPLPNG